MSEANKQRAAELKEKGNTAFSAKKYELAVNYYSKAILEDPSDSIFYANRAMCRLKLNNYEETIRDCDKAIQYDSNYAKAYWRRGLANRSLKRFLEAKKDFEKALTLEPDNRGIKEDILKLAQEEKALSSSNSAVPSTGSSGSTGSAHSAAVSQTAQQPGELKPASPQPSQQKPSQQPAGQPKPASPQPSQQKPSQQPAGQPKPASPQPSQQKPVGQPKPASPQPSQQKPSQQNPSQSHLSQPKPPHQNPPQPHPSLPKSSQNAPKASPPPSSSQRQPPSKNTKKPSPTTLVATEEDYQKIMNSIAIIQPTIVPNEAPTSMLEFERTWRNFSDLNNKFHYFKIIPPTNYSKIFKSSMTTDLLLEIATILKQFYVKQENDFNGAWAVLTELSKLDRFDMLSMFFSATDKAGLRELFELLRDKNLQNFEKINNLYLS